MKLRKLEMRDAQGMYEWMHDEDVCEHMRADFSKKTMKDCEAFVIASQNSSQNLHLGIVDECDEYMGTVSLKNIHYEEGYAEFGIVLRKCAMGKGYSRYGMEEIIRIGKEDLKLKRIIWCVSKSNLRANRLYQKMQYRETEDIPQPLEEEYQDLDDLNWYSA